MEDITTRAITIGVSVLIAVATISAVMTYYSTAQEAVRRVGSGTDIAGLYEQGIEDILLKNKATGVEVKNLINYFSNRGDASFTTNEIQLMPNPGYSGLADEKYREFLLKYLIPSAKYEVDHEIIDGIIHITIRKGV